MRGNGIYRSSARMEDVGSSGYSAVRVDTAGISSCRSECLEFAGPPIALIGFMPASSTTCWRKNIAPD